MEIDEELGRLSRVYGEPIEKVKERFEEAKKEIQTEAPQADPETVKTRASEMTLGQLHRKMNGKVRLFVGFFLACDGRVNDYAARTSQHVRALANTLGPKKAQEEGLIDTQGRPLYPKNNRNAHQVIKEDELFFAIKGIVFEGNEKPKDFFFKVYNLDLLKDVVLNRPVRFNASMGLYNNSPDRLSLVSEPTTRFDYFALADIAKEPDVAMAAARTVFQPLAAADLPLLVKTEKDKDGKDVVTVDRRSYLLKDMVVSGVYKPRPNQMYIEVTHPTMMGWDIVVIYPTIKYDYSIVRDRRADILAKIFRITPAEKKIIMFGDGYWQEAEFRAKKPIEEVAPNKVTMRFKE